MEKGRFIRYTMHEMKKLSQSLLIVGGLNWLLLGLFGWDIGQLFGGMDAFVSKVVYVLVGLSAVYQLATGMTKKPQQ